MTHLDREAGKHRTTQAEDKESCKVALQKEIRLHHSPRHELHREAGERGKM